jgi:hypothetical protein
MLLPTILVAGLLCCCFWCSRIWKRQHLRCAYTIMWRCQAEGAPWRRHLTLALHHRLFRWRDPGTSPIGLNPWNDPSGRSYQIVQSLLSIANGGIAGRGLGIGSPGLVPVAHSDFIYTAIAEESGLSGSMGLLAVYALLFGRGLLIALRAVDRFRRLLAAGLTAYLGIQSLLIIGGDLRMLPLTGVTLPFVSYGGSSLLTSSVAAAILITISNNPGQRATRLDSGLPYAMIAALLGFGIGRGVAQSWWATCVTDLLRTDNARRAIADRYVKRGALLDRNNLPITSTVGTSGSLWRTYQYSGLGPIIGYTHPTFGQAGIEASMDTYLRGTQGNPLSLLIWDQLVYGTPPQGLDVRLTIDLGLQPAR